MEPPNQVALEAGVELGHFRLVHAIGGGAQGSVWLAEDLRLHRRVALKVLSPTLRLDREAIERFRREAKAAARIDHPGICTIHETGEIDGMPFIAMQLVDGETLGARISAWKSAREADGDEGDTSSSRVRRERILQVVELFEQAACALQHAHNLGVVHRDIKPSNLMIAPDGHAVLVDFGLARDLEGRNESVTRVGDLFGTPRYMSPEQITRQSIRVDHRTDVFSLGVSLYEALTLERPFDAPTLEGLFLAILAKEPRNPRRLVPEISRDLAVVVGRALEKDRDRRYSTAGDLAADLRSVLSLRPIRAKPITIGGRILRWTKREPALAALTLTAVVGVPLLAGLVGYVLASQPEIEAGKRVRITEEADRLADEGFMDLLTNRGDRGERLFQAALEVDPTSIMALAGLCELRAADPRAALELLSQHAETLAGDPDFVAIEGLTLWRAGREQEAQERYQDPVLRNSGVRHLAQGTQLWTDLDNYDLQAGRDALRHFDLAAFKARRPLFIGQYLRGAAAFVAREDVALDETIEVMQDLWPENPATWVSTADWLLLSDDPRGPAALKRAFELAPDVAWVNEIAGHYCLHFGRPEEALRWFDLADEIGLAAGERKLTLPTHRARALLALGRPEPSAAMLSKQIDSLTAEDMLTFRTSAYFVLAEAELRCGQPQAALETLDRAAEIAPGLERLSHERVRVQRGMGEMDAARSTLEDAMRANPHWPWWHFERGLTLFVEGRIDAARGALEDGQRALAADPDWKLRDAAFFWPEEAGVRARLELAAELAPEDVEAWSALTQFHLDSRLRRLALDPAAALSAARHAASLAPDSKHLAWHARAAWQAGELEIAQDLRLRALAAAKGGAERAALQASLARDFDTAAALIPFP